MSQSALCLSPRARSFLLARPPAPLLARALLADRRGSGHSLRLGRETEAAAQGERGGGGGGGGGKMSGEDEQQEQTIAEDLVVTKYKMGGDIANRECGPRGSGGRG